MKLIFGERLEPFDYDRPDALRRSSAPVVLLAPPRLEVDPDPDGDEAA